MEILVNEKTKKIKSGIKFIKAFSLYVNIYLRLFLIISRMFTIFISSVIIEK